MCDYHEIINLMGRYSQIIDRREFSELSEIFDDESVWVTAIGVPVTGVAAIKLALEVLVQFRAATDLHVQTNVVVDIDGNKATSSSDWLFLDRGDGDAWRIASAGSYADEFRRTGERWIFARRQILV